MVEWLDYCEHCGTTKPPKRKVSVKATLEGTVQSDERKDLELDTDVLSDVWVCSECGHEVNVERG
jgi:rubrerythrin